MELSPTRFQFVSFFHDFLLHSTLSLVVYGLHLLRLGAYFVTLGHHVGHLWNALDHHFGVLGLTLVDFGGSWCPCVAQGCIKAQMTKLCPLPGRPFAAQGGSFFAVLPPRWSPHRPNIIKTCYKKHIAKSGAQSAAQEVSGDPLEQ